MLGECGAIREEIPTNLEWAEGIGSFRE